jgi:hypothetical protein
MYLDDKQFELLYNTYKEASADHILLTTLLTKSVVKPVRWDMPVPDLMVDIDIHDSLECLKPNSIIIYKTPNKINKLL